MGCCGAALLDMLHQARACGAFDPIILVTDDPYLRAEAGSPIHLEESGPDFHFGRRLLEVVRTYRLETVTVAGAGSGPLLQAEDRWRGTSSANLCTNVEPRRSTRIG